MTPCFLGAGPASAPLLGPAPLRPLAGAEDLARQLVRSLDAGQAGQAILLDQAPWEIGPTESGAPLYYRLQGPRLLIEYGNTQRAANHAHSVWRDPEADFGYDALGAHLARHHRLQESIPLAGTKAAFEVGSPVN